MSIDSNRRQGRILVSPRIPRRARRGLPPPPSLSLSLSRALSVVVGFLSFDSEKAEERIDGFANEGRGRGGVEIAVGLVDLVGSRALVKPAARLYG
jgi:hypothetical protein